MSKKKVLIVNDVLQYGGSDLVAIRLQQNLNSEKFESVYCIRRETEGELEAYLKSTGVRIIHQPDNMLGYINSYKFYKDLFKKEHFDIVHSHLLFYSGIVLLAAKNAGIKKRVAHSHFSQPLNPSKYAIKRAIANTYRFFMRMVLRLSATDIIGCSKQTGEYLAGKKTFQKIGHILNNGIDTSVFNFNSDMRNETREKLNIKGCTAIGHIGHMYRVKNQSFSIDVFNEYLKQDENAVLILIGDGEDREKLEKKIDVLKLKEKIMLLGYRDDVPQIMNAIDLFIFPSIHEGFPLTLIEAQACKLPCLISDTVNNDTKINENVDFVSLNDNISVWCRKAKKLLEIDRNSVDISDLKKNFDIKEITKDLEKIYLDY